MNDHDETKTMVSQWDAALEALGEATAALTTTLDPEQVLDRILEQVGRIVPSDAVNIMLIENERARIVRWRGYERFGPEMEAFVSNVTFHIPEVHNLKRMLENREPVVIADTATCPGWVHRPVQAWLRSYATAPIIVDDEMIGFLNVDSATLNTFTPAHASTLRTFAMHAAAAIKNARLYEAMQAAQEYTRNIIESSLDIIITVDMERHIVEFNRAAQKAFGYNRQEVLGQHVDMLYADPAESLKVHQTTIKESQCVCEIFNRRKDGRAFPTFLFASVLKKATGELVGVMGVLRNITARVEREEALWLLSSAVEQSSEGIAVGDLASNIMYSNPAFADAHGYTVEEIIGQPLSIFHTSEQMPSVEAANQQIQETGEFNGEIWHVRRDGTVFPALMHNSLLRDEMGEAIGIISTLRDITKRVQMEESLRRRNLDLALLNQATRALSSILDLDQVFNNVLEQVRNLLGVVACSIWLKDPETGELVCRQATGDQSEIVRDWRLAPGEGLVGWVARHGESLIVPDVRDDPRYFKGVDQQTELSLRSIVSVPLHIVHNVIGVLQAMAEEVDYFNTADLTLLEPLAMAAAISIESARLFSEAQQRVDELEALRHISLQITSLLDVPTVLDSIVESALNLVGADDCHIFLYDQASESFTFGTALWQNGQREPAVQAPRKTGFTAMVARQRQIVVINDASQHPLYSTPKAQKWGVQAIAGFPLKRADRIVGVFTAAFLKPHTFSEDELRVLSLLADQAVIAIENARLVQGLEAEVIARTAEIMAEKEKSEAILHSVGDAITMIDREMRIQYVNPAFTALTGHTAEEVIGQYASSVGAGATSEPVQQAIESAMSEGKLWQGEVISQRKDGRTYDAALTITPMRDTEGQLVGYVSSHRDISRLKELDWARKRFITNISHQLRTPLTNLKLYTHMLRKGTSPEKTDHYLEVLEGEMGRLSHLVQDIVEMTALDSGQAVTDWKPVPAPRIVKNTITRYQSQAKKANLRLVAAPTLPDLPMVKGDEKRLTQALGELVENAIIFTPAGGRVIVETGTVKKDEKAWVTVTVRDSGPGITPQEQEQIFDRFYRGSLAEAGHIPGTGLGLSFVQEIMQAHGGHVTVESKVGAGSAFTLWLQNNASGEV